MPYRNNQTGAVVEDIRALFPHVSFPNAIPPADAEALGYSPLINNPLPATTPFQKIINAGLVQDVNGNWMYNWQIQDMAADEAAAKLAQMRSDLLNSAAAKRVEVEAQGLSYTFPDGSGTIQTRDNTDLRNINGLVTSALVLQSMGKSTTTIGFRDAENITHQMTPAQIIQMGMAVNEFVSATYAAKWQHEQNIGTWDGTTTYNLNIGWPS